VAFIVLAFIVLAFIVWPPAHAGGSDKFCRARFLIHE
jgi:hypothetical protein